MTFTVSCYHVHNAIKECYNLTVGTYSTNREDEHILKIHMTPVDAHGDFHVVIRAAISGDIAEVNDYSDSFTQPTRRTLIWRSKMLPDSTYQTNSMTDFTVAGVVLVEVNMLYARPSEMAVNLKWLP